MAYFKGQHLIPDRPIYCQTQWPYTADPQAIAHGVDLCRGDKETSFSAACAVLLVCMHCSVCGPRSVFPLFKVMHVPRREAVYRAFFC